MHLTRLRLRNVCQHEERDWTFGPGLIGVLGPNGSGKTNAFNVGCYCAFTGDFSRHAHGKAGMVRQQAGDEATADILVSFEQDGGVYTLRRGLQHPDGVSLQVPGGEQLKGARAVEERLEGVLGLTKRLIRDYVFVNQRELFAFLSADPAERVQGFAHLCGTTQAEQLWELLGKQIATDSVLATATDDNRDYLRSKLRELRLEDGRLQQALQAAKAEQLSAEEEAELREVLRTEAERSRLERELTAAGREESTAKEAAKTAYNAVKTAREQQAKVQAALEELGHDGERVEFDLREAEQQAKDYQRAADYRGQLRRLSEQLAALPEGEADAAGLRELQSQEGRLAGRIADRQHLLTLAEESGTCDCPTCGTSGESLDIPALAAECETWEQERRRLSQSIRSREANLERSRAAEHSRAKLVGQIEAKQEAVQALGEVVEVPSQELERLRGAVQNWKRLQAQHAQAGMAVQAEQLRFESYRSRHVAAKEALKKLSQALAGLPETTTSSEECQVSLDAHRQAQLQERELRGQHQAVVTALRERQDELLAAEARLRQAEALSEFAGVLGRMRDVLHRDCLPRRVHLCFLEEIQEEINETLAGFQRPFFVETREDVSFQARFADGTVMPGTGLSGGQKVLLALPFRMAVNSLFASRVGMMVLDEPTDGLDADNRRLAAEAFRRFGDLVRSRHQQVFVITHDQALEGVFDQSVRLIP